MNLAWKDVRRQGPRFVLTGMGLGLLFAIVLAMGGIYRGLVDDATLLVDAMDAPLWIVQRDTRGPFAERSVLPQRIDERARAIDGVSDAWAFVSTTIQREHLGRALRISIVGVDWPSSRGERLPIIDGRALRSPHREIVADRSLGLALGERIELAGETYTVVGLMRGVVSAGGDGVAFLTVADALEIQGYSPPEAHRSEHDSRAVRFARTDYPRTLQREAPDARAIAVAVGRPTPNAVLVFVRPGASIAHVRETISHWADVSVYSGEEQRQLLLQGVVEKSRQQIGLFRGLLVVVAMIIVALILYNMTTARSREIALLKLMGARTRVVIGMILQQSLMLGALGYSFALLVAAVAFERFPRRVVLSTSDLVGIGALVLGICVLASVAGVAKAMRIPATMILSG